MWKNFKKIIMTIIFILAMTIPVQPIYAGPLCTFDTEINLSSNPSASLDPQLAASGDNVYVVWADNGEILLRRSRDNGKTWEPIINLSNTLTPSTSPQISAAGKYVHVVWSEYFDNGLEIVYRRITDIGASLVFDPPPSQPPVNLSNRPLASQAPRIAASGSSVYIAWADEFDAFQANLGPPPGALSDEVLFKASKDNGNSFLISPLDPPINLSRNLFSPPSSLEIAAADNSVYIAWAEGGSLEVFFMASLNNGDSLKGPVVSYRTGAYISPPTNPINLSNTPGIGADTNSLTPKIAASGNSVYVVWQERAPTSGNRNSEILFRASNDNGVTFNPPPSLPGANLSNTPKESIRPRIAASGDSVYVFWVDLSDGSFFGPLFRASRNAGATFGSILNLRPSEQPFLNEIALAASDNNVYAAWAGGFGQFLIATVVRCSIDNGVTFDSPTGASTTGGGRINLHLAISGRNVYVLWERGVRGIFGAEPEIIFAAGHVVPPPNQPPTVVLPPAVTVNCASLTGVALSGVAVTLTAQVGDPDGDALTVIWKVDGVVVQTDSVPAGGPPTSANVTLTYPFPMGEHIVTVTVSDGKAAAVSASTMVTIIPDTTPPTITLNGDNPVTLECPTSYQDPGATVKDDCDSNPTLTISGSVDSHKPGDYTITYTAKDASGNTSSTTRTVKVVDTKPPEIMCSLTPTTNPLANQINDKGKAPAGQNLNSGFFVIQYSAKDACDPNPTTVATICGFAVANGETIKYTLDPDIAEPKLVMIGPNTNKIKHIICPKPLTIMVTSTDASGNTAVKECSPLLAAPVLIPADFALRLKHLQLPDSIFIPTDFALGQNYPQPFNPETWIPYSLPKDIEVTIRIYSGSGVLIRALDLGYKQAGFYTTKDRAAYWDGRNNHGERVSSGLYFYQIQAGEFTATRKMLLLK